MPRGRPRQFDEDTALTAAMHLFWEKGLSATSLDDLEAAMGMKRPSIYLAFGDKEALYRTALERFCGQLTAGVDEVLEGSQPLRPALVAFYDRAIDVYTATEPSMGCLMVCTAPAEALVRPEVGSDLAALLARLDRAFARRLRRAMEERELPPDIAPELTAQLLQATLQTVALRARAGASKRSLRKLTRHAVERLTRS
ncbi:MAG: TetR/AcrR family transcriptional regulator [Myxococcota bacterium]